VIDKPQLQTSQCGYLRNRIQTCYWQWGRSESTLLARG